jgi:hypothetical protein
LDLIRIATVTDDHVNLAADQVVVLRDINGQYWVATSSGELDVFDSVGRFRRRVGRPGTGPGELRRPFYMAVARGDSVLVADRETRRISVFDPTLSRTSRVFPIGSLHEFLALPSGRLVASGTVSGERSGGLSMHLLNDSGRVTKSASAEERMLGDRGSTGLVRSLALAPKSDILAATMRRYRIERWSSDLQFRAVYERAVDWFPALPHDTPVDLPNRKPMPSSLLAILGDTTSNLIISIIRTAERPFAPDPMVAQNRGEGTRAMMPRMSALMALSIPTLK